MRSLYGLVFVTALAVSCAGQPEPTSPERFGRFRPREAAELFLHLREDPPHFDPVLAANHTDAFLAEQLFEGLTVLDETSLAPVPALAESWTQSGDGRRYLFRLRRDARWSDGQPVTADDVIFAWERLLRPQTAAVSASSLYALHGARSYHQGRRRRVIGRDVVPRRAPFVVLGQGEQQGPIAVLPFPPDAVVELDDSNLRVAAGAAGAVLRAAPLHDATPVGSLPYGVTAIVVARQSPRSNALDGQKPKTGGFVQLRVPGRSDAAWVAESEVEPTFPTSALRTVEGDRRHRGRMPLRDAPQQEREPFTEIEDGDQVHLLETKSPWARVLHERSGVVGWLPEETLDDVMGNRNWFYARVTGDFTPDTPYAQEGWVSAVHLLEDASVLGARALASHELQVDLEAETPYFLSLLALPATRPLPRRIVERYGRRWTDPLHIVTNGPFVVQERRLRERVVFARSSHYREADEVALERVTFFVVPDAQVVLDLFGAGYLDALLGGGVPLEFMRRLSRTSEYREAPGLASFYLRLNHQVTPLQDPRVRQALSLSIDKERLVSRLEGRGRMSASSFVPPGIPGYPSVTAAEYDPVTAKRLLADAGYPGGHGFPPLELLLSTDEELRYIGIPLQHQWSEVLGIQVSLLLLDSAAIRRRMVQSDYAMARAGWLADHPDPTSFLEVWRSDSAANYSGYQNTNFDAALDAASQTRDPLLRLQKLAEAESILLQDLPFIPLYFPSHQVLVAPEVQGIVPNALDLHHLAKVFLAPYQVDP